MGTGEICSVFLTMPDEKQKLAIRSDEAVNVLPADQRSKLGMLTRIWQSCRRVFLYEEALQCIKGPNLNVDDRLSLWCNSSADLQQQN